MAENRIPIILKVLYIVLPLWGIWYYATNAAPSSLNRMDMSNQVAIQQNGQQLISAGKQISAQEGCFACHGPEGKGGNENPGTKDKAVPGWNSSDLSSNNLFYPILLKQEIEHAVIRSMYDDPTDIGNQEYAPFKMQPWIGRLTSEQIKEIMAYIYSINPSLQDNMKKVLAQDKSLPDFNEVSGDITQAFDLDTTRSPVTVNGSPLGTPAVSQVPYGSNYPNLFDDYYSQHKDDTPPQSVKDVAAFAKLIGLKF
ncbi:c-type cytochrome [Desulfosporosinus sp. SYSU MS00001]|uniref:c-type cytochrome n=1 Tax=Desulfosporosinus sp. SYSU MS00001 TaxID=3416284 RepID=UPI003CF95034